MFNLPPSLPLPPGPVSRRTFMTVALLTGMGISGVAAAQPSPQSLLQQGLERYTAGEFQAAITLWQSAAQTLQRQGDPLRQGLALIYISTAHQHLGNWPEAQQSLEEGFQILEQGRSADSTTWERAWGQALNAQGSLHLALGRPQQALSSWQQAERAYGQVQDLPGQVGTQINQTQALQVLGLNQRARQVLQRLSQQVQPLSDVPLKVSGLRALGNAQRSTGLLQASRQTLQESLTLAEGLADPDLRAGVQLDLGHTLQSLTTAAFEIADRNTGVEAAAAALIQYQSARQIGRSSQIQLQAQLNQLNLHLILLKASQQEPVRIDPAVIPTPIDPQRHQERLAQLWPPLLDQLSSLPPSRPVLYARINLAVTLLDLQALAASIPPPATEITALLEETIRQAEQVNDRPALAYALGTQGRLYLEAQQLDRAQAPTEQALLVAQSINAPEVSYLWQWQLGQILRRQNRPAAALAAYSSAYESLQSLRQDLVSVTPSLQFSFRDSVEPVYREYIEMLLDSQPTSSPHLLRSRQVLESLQMAELNNFFRDSCLDTTLIPVPIDLDQVDPQAAVIYPIVLSDRMEVILSLSGQPLRSYPVPVSRQQVEATTADLRRQVVKLIDPSGYLEPAQQIYDWLIRPVEADLQQAQVTTLVFVLDSLLRGLPVAALYESQGQQHLVQRYDLALTPGLQLLDPQPLQRQNLQALKAGLTEARQGFSELTNVSTEIDQVSARLPGERLLNEQFTSATLAQRIQKHPPPVVHLATHGQFSSRADQTFVLTWSDRIDIELLAALLRPDPALTPNRGAVELLTLSACETASGDNRAALGLAGVAVRAGARSTLASLWAVNDGSTADLMARFYQILTEEPISKAAALRQAQLQLLGSSQHQHPYFWSPFVLVGNWL